MIRTRFAPGMPTRWSLTTGATSVPVSFCAVALMYTRGEAGARGVEADRPRPDDGAAADRGVNTGVVLVEVAVECEAGGGTVDEEGALASEASGNASLLAMSCMIR
jgi:hypothetical protein